MKNIYLIIVFFLFAFSSCNHSETKTETEKQTLKKIVKKPENISFSYEEILGSEDMGNFKIKVFLEIDGEKHFLEEEGLPGLDEMMSPAEEMKNNLASAGGWWAGFGVNYAAFWDSGKIIVKKETLEELTEEMIEENPELAKPMVEILKEIKIDAK